MRRQRIRLTEGDLRRIVNRSVRRVLREFNEDITAFEYSHLGSNDGLFIVAAHFYDYTYCFKTIELETFNDYGKAKQYAQQMYYDNDAIYDLIEDVYSEMGDDEETSIDDVNFEVYQNSVDENGHNAVYTTRGVGIRMNDILR